MAFSAARSFSRLTTRLVSCGRINIKNFVNSNQSILATCLSGTQRNLTRSLWHMCRDKHVGLGGTTPHTSLSKPCGCCHLHTEGDKEMVEFLKQEIQVEQGLEKTSGQLPRIKGFEVELDGAEVTLTKKSDSETIVVTFNINNSVDAEEEEDLEEMSQEPEKPPEMVSKPDFLVEINKGGSTTLALQCGFPPKQDDPEDLPPDVDGEQYDDVIEIQEVALLESGKDWVDSTYCVNAAIMDGNLYDLLLNSLEDRGIDADFADRLVDFSTSLEHQKYINFLEGLSVFSSK